MTHLFPPFDPDDAPERQRVRQLRQIPIRLLLPNLLTLLALCAGLTAIRMALEGRFDYAVAAIVFAGILDGIDGRIARLLKSTSRFGAQLDSLTDFVNFGAAPAVLLFAWTLDEARSVGWMAALVFAICAALRLARFNVALDAPEKPEWQQQFFVGVPAPAGAGTVLLPLYLESLGVPHSIITTPIVIVYTIFVGLLMISRLPTWSGKAAGGRISRDAVLPIFVLVVVFAALLVSFPWLVLSLSAIAYLASLPFAWNAFQRLKAAENGKMASAASVVQESGSQRQGPDA
jgi:CDP-diacylglycerol--serine O-phosphatidyltransferase